MYSGIFSLWIFNHHRAAWTIPQPKTRVWGNKQCLSLLQHCLHSRKLFKMHLSTQYLPFFFFLSRKKSVREEPSVLLLNKGGNNEKPSLLGHILHWMYPWYWKCMSVADNCPLFRSSSSLGHEERPLKFVASVHSLLICSQHNYFLVHLFFTEYFFKILLIKKSGLQGPVGILSFPQHFH